MNRENWERMSARARAVHLLDQLIPGMAATADDFVGQLLLAASNEQLRMAAVTPNFDLPGPLPDVLKEPTCEGCRFWRGPSQCHRHAPQMLTSMARVWPIVHFEDWCGDHEPK